MQWLPKCVQYNEEETADRQTERHGKMRDLQMFCSLYAEFVDFLGQRGSGAVLMESRCKERQADKRELYQRKRSNRVLTTYIRYVLGWAASEEF